MGVVISLEERRRVQKGRIGTEDDQVASPAFVAAFEPIFEALELVETIPLPKTARARELLLRGLEVMLEMEKRRLRQCAR
ncbi:hypothetical protein FJV80_04320 [Mesorhizobium sp. WSM4310]|uniref:hypothetical protein n=1 Tax=Mesorhizobium sp. WSM4310 TaxID=2589883 RepID=UPI00115F24AC|nr:hypothetical protein [Mesorhizobium sp. WSM4310]TRC91153.1 hypothetical protein FJV80_04320 [Mesorhizobium sp. WSM4310]